MILIMAIASWLTGNDADNGNCLMASCHLPIRMGRPVFIIQREFSLIFALKRQRDERNRDS